MIIVYSESQQGRMELPSSTKRLRSTPSVLLLSQIQNYRCLDDSSRHCNWTSDVSFVSPVQHSHNHHHYYKEMAAQVMVGVLVGRSGGSWCILPSPLDNVPFFTNVVYWMLTCDGKGGITNSITPTNKHNNTPEPNVLASGPKYGFRFSWIDALLSVVVVQIEGWRRTGTQGIFEVVTSYVHSL